MFNSNFWYHYVRNIKGKIILFNFNEFPFKLSGKTVDYICPNCKYKFQAPIEAVLQFEEEDEWNNLPISTPPYTIFEKCLCDKCVSIDYKSAKGYHFIYKENKQKIFINNKHSRSHGYDIFTLSKILTWEHDFSIILKNSNILELRYYKINSFVFFCKYHNILQ